MVLEAGRAVLFGGPLDGHTTATRSLLFIWVSPFGSGVRVFDKPGQGRLLYRRVNDYEFAFAGLTHAVCCGCDGVHPRNPQMKCSLCGEHLIPA